MSEAVHMGELPARKQEEYLPRKCEAVKMTNTNPRPIFRGPESVQRNEPQETPQAFKPRKAEGLVMSKLPSVNNQRRARLTAANRKVGEVLKDGAWKGERCFIIGGGQSVKNFDLSKLAHEHTIGVNMAFRLLSPEIIIAYDARLWGWIETNDAGANDKELFDACKALKIWADIGGSPMPEDVIIAPSIGRPGLSMTLQEGLGWGTNSGFGALNLALLLGASEIYLIGFDFYGTRWHNGYPSGGDSPNDFHLTCYEEASTEIRKFPSRIINLNPQSKLKLFEFGTMPEDLRTGTEQRKKGANEPIFVSYFTPDNGYKKYADDLKASLERWQIDHDIQAVKNRGNWDANTKAKPEFILQMLDRYPERDVVWIDADAVVLRLPEQLLKVAEGVDFACRIRETGELISSVMFFKNNAVARKLLKKTQALIDKGEKHPFGEQIFFQRALESFEGKKSGLTAINLPEEYCDILGISTPANPTVIEMRQASRSLKT